MVDANLDDSIVRDIDRDCTQTNAANLHHCIRTWLHKYSHCFFLMHVDVAIATRCSQVDSHYCHACILRLCQSYRRLCLRHKLSVSCKPGGLGFWAPRPGKLCFFWMQLLHYSCSKVTDYIYSKRAWTNIRGTLRDIPVECSEMRSCNLRNNACTSNRARARNALCFSVSKRSSQCRNAAFDVAHTTTDLKALCTPINTHTTLA